ncbi:DUF7009 family protein [Pedobacter sp. GSP4]|uniref:DUF7009 family protein n=1 Tax=Pedobacter sp. GSP4 TaxID=3453716 RepID=UPI003EE9E2A3
MKIRIKGNFIRYRLTRSEVDGLAENKTLAETVDFGSRKLIYSITCTADNNMSASFIGDEINLKFPSVWLAEWQTTDRVGYKAEDGTLGILLEKDFTCLDQVEEDQSDNYPNPLLNESK